MAGSGVLYVVATPIGNMGDISARAREILAGVGAVAAEDTRHSGRLLQRARPRAAARLAARAQRARAHRRAASRGCAAARASRSCRDAGTPLVSDPGYLLVAAAIARRASRVVAGARAECRDRGAVASRACRLRALFLRRIPAGARRGAPRAPRRARGGAAHAGVLRSAASHRRVPRRHASRHSARAAAPASRASSPSASRRSIAARSASSRAAREATRISRAARSVIVVEGAAGSRAAAAAQLDATLARPAARPAAVGRPRRSPRSLTGVRRNDAYARALALTKDEPRRRDLRRRLAAGAMVCAGVGQAIAASQECGGKSGLRRARCQVTPGGREPTESATENKPPKRRASATVRVKWCGKSAPRRWQHSAARQTPPGARPNREARGCKPQRAARTRFRVGRLRCAATRIPEE